MLHGFAAALIILGPILHPIAESMGIHLSTSALSSPSSYRPHDPPVGACLFVACSISKISLARLSKAIFPFIIMEVLALFIVASLPEISLLLPKLLGFA